MEGGSDEQLLGFKVTPSTKSNTTSVGLCMSRGLCTSISQPFLVPIFVLTRMISVDATGLLEFLGLLPQFCQGLSPIESRGPLTPAFQDLYRFCIPATPPWELPDGKTMDSG